MKTSFIELKGRERAEALLDNGSFRELLGPFDRIESPHLAPQGIVPEFDDGMIIAKGTLSGQDVIVLSIEGAFQGGGIGEVCGSKIAGSLERALVDNKNGKKVIPIIVFDTGGVRLQEANYGLLIISEIQAAIVALKRYVPVIALIPGNVGCFGGMSITAALCSNIIMTETARFGLNGPEVIEQEAGIKEFNSRDRRLIWDTIGGSSRFKSGMVDQLVDDDIETFRLAIIKAFDTTSRLQHTLQADRYLSLLSRIDPLSRTGIDEVVKLLDVAEPANIGTIKDDPTPGRGRTWFKALTGDAPSISEYPSVLVADVQFNGKETRFVAVVANAANAYPRARHGEVGLLEGWALAKYVRQAVDEDAGKPVKRNIVAIIDVPSQAYGYIEELVGIPLSCAAAVDAYATARINGHAVTGIIVGNAISGGFLSHGLQASRLIGLDDPAINVQAMSKQSAARITKRTIKELEEATAKVPAMAYDIKSYNSLGPLDTLIEGINVDAPDAENLNTVKTELSHAISLSDDTVKHRLETPQAENGRRFSRLVRTKIAEQWN
jgi:malonate decarboxylase beta subunit